MTNASLSSGAVREHLDRTVRTWLGIPASARVPTPTLPIQLAHRLLRVEEYECQHRDQWGCWEYGFSESFWRGALWVPEVDSWVEQQRQEVASDLDLEPRWPEERAFAVCLTHDVDMVSRQMTPLQAWRGLRQALRFREPSGQLVARLSDAARQAARALHFGMHRTPITGATLEQCLDLEREYGVRGSYFFTVLPLRPSPYDCTYALDDPCRFRGRRVHVGQVIRELVAEGFDVGLHGSYGSAIDFEALSVEKAALEGAAGVAIRSTRQHYLHWEIDTTPRLQEQVGLRADSTLGFNRNVGFRAGSSLPFYWFDLLAQSRRDVLEVPLIIQEAALMGGNALDLNLELAKQIIDQMMQAVQRVGGVLTLLFHPHSLLSTNYVALFRWSIEQSLSRGAWVTSLGDIERWWRGREARLGYA